LVKTKLNRREFTVPPSRVTLLSCDPLVHDGQLSDYKDKN